MKKFKLDKKWLSIFLFVFGIVFLVIGYNLSDIGYNDISIYFGALSAGCLIGFLIKTKG